MKTDSAMAKASKSGLIRRASALMSSRGYRLIDGTFYKVTNDLITRVFIETSARSSDPVRVGISHCEVTPAPPTYETGGWNGVSIDVAKLPLHQVPFVLNLYGAGVLPDKESIEVAFSEICDWIDENLKMTPEQLREALRDKNSLLVQKGSTHIDILRWAGLNQSPLCDSDLDW